MLRFSNTVMQKGHEYFKILLNLKEKIKNSRDHLKFILYLTQWPWSFKIIKFHAVMTLLYHTCNVISFIYKDLISFNRDNAVRQASVVGFSIFFLANIGNILLTGDDVINFAVKYKRKLLPVEFANEPNYRKILLTSSVLKFVIFSTFVITYAAGILLVHHDSFNNKFYLIQYLKKFKYSDFSKFAIYYFKCTTVVSAHMTIVGACILSYVGFHTAFQLRILRVFVEHVCDRKCDEKEQYYNKMNQKSISQKLKIVIMFHAFLDKSIRELTRINYRATLLYSGGVLFFGGGIMIEVLSASEHQQEQQKHDSNMAFVFVTLAGLLTLGLYACVGQAMKNESEELHKTLTVIPWYNMNQDNKVLLSLLLFQTKKVISFDIDLLQMDHQLVVRILKGLYTMSTIVARMQN